METKYLSLCIGAALLAATTSAQALDIKLGHVLPTTHSWHIAAEGFAKDVTQATEGRVNLTVFPNGQLGNEKVMLEGMQIGSVHAAVIGCGSFQPVEPKFGIVELPYSWEKRESAYAAFDGELGDALEELALQKNLRIISWWENGFRHVTNNRGPIATPADLANLKIRVTPDKMRLDTFTALGASPAPLAFGELYSALQQGVFDAQENPLSIIYSSSFNEVQRYVSLTSHVWAPACLTFTDFTWKRISPEDQATVREMAARWRDTQREMTRQDDEALVGKLRDKGMRINHVDLPSFQDAVDGVWQQYTPLFGDDLMSLVEHYRRAK